MEWQWDPTLFAGTAAHDASDRIIYDKSSGALFFDADGNDPTIAQHLFAFVTPGVTLTFRDFFVSQPDIVV